MKIVQVNGIDLAYARRGRGTPLTLLHGYPLDHHIWDAIVPMLEDSFDLILPDLRGFGNSSTVETPYTLNEFASDIVGLLDHLGIEKTAIAGHSMGGYVALTFVRHYPDRVSGLGLVSSQALADSPERREGRYKSAAEVAEKGIDGVVEAMAAKLSPDKALQNTAMEIMQRQPPAAYIGALKAMAERMDATALFPAFEFPVVIVHGDADELIPVERAREVKAVIPHAHLAEVTGAGHLPMMESPEKTA
ncbi:MAG: alpha/beta fold hydrolase, partial [Anaerolineales bacterium]|nr:alpha/beta fold hydrolase [Anaerolineales bacterium]